MKPFLKWAGGKQRIVGRILACLPAGERLIEPFVGSGAVFLNSDYPASWLNDNNPDLIDLYRHLQDDLEGFITACRPLFDPHQNQAEVYYAFRQEFNATHDRRRKAALFLYLNKHGYNGLCRYNARGGFNTPFGRHTSPSLPENELRFFGGRLQNAQLTSHDFAAVMESALPGDVVYCDPPYVPLSATANFTGYSVGGFDLDAQQELARQAIQLSGRGIPVLISNHDTPLTRQLYAPAEIHSFEVQRFISAKGDQRGKAKELLAVFGVG